MRNREKKHVCTGHNTFIICKLILSSSILKENQVEEPKAKEKKTELETYSNRLQIDCMSLFVYILLLLLYFRYLLDGHEI